MDNAKDLLSSNLRRLRDERRWTQADLAEAADLSVQMIQKIEYGRTSPSPQTLDKLTRALGSPASELFVQPKTATFRSLNEASSFLSKLSSSPPLLREAVFAIVQNETKTIQALPKEIAKLVLELIRECSK